MVREQAGHAGVVSEPPRDGEFFLDEEYGIDERLTSTIHHGTAGLAPFLSRFPVLSLGLAAACGMIVSTVIYAVIT